MSYDKVAVLIRDAHDGADLIAVGSSDRPRAAVYLARMKNPGTNWSRYDPEPMPAELRAKLEAAGLFVPAA